MSELRALKRILKNLEYISATADEFSPNTHVNEIKTNLAILNDEWKDLQGIEKSLGAKINEPQLEVVSKIETVYFTVKQVLYRHEKAHEMENAHTSANMDNLMANQTQFIHELSLLNKRDSEVRLPRVNIPPFSGNYSEFPSFKDLFETSIDKNENMSQVHKLQYLKSLLKDDAYTLIKHLNVTEANYKQAWEKVKARYNKPKHVVYTLLKQFMDQPVLQQSSDRGLRQITDVSDEVIRGLHVLGENATKRDPWLIYILVNKLDAESKEAWAHASANQDFPSIETFFEFLNKRSDALECITSTQRQKLSFAKKVGAMASQVAISGVCPMCSGEHYLGRCSKYLELPIIERKELAANKKLCFNCLSSTHQAVVCRSKYVCRICKRKHHATLHLDSKIDPNNEEEQIKTNESGPSLDNGEKEFDVFVAIKSKENSAKVFQAILPTAIVLIEDKMGHMQECRALLDSGSQSSFVSENCAQRLQLAREKTNVRITGLTAGNLTSRGKSTIVLQSRYDDNIKTNLEVLIIKHLPTQIPKARIWLDNNSLMKDLNLADPKFYIPSPIDVLIGADKFFEILKMGQKRCNSLILNNTVFGWVIAGEPRTTDNDDVEVFTTFTHENMNLEPILKKFWEIEDIPDNADKFTPEESECEKLFLNTHKRGADGRFIVKLPFKKNISKLGDSLQVATTRFRSLERRLSSNTELRETYIAQMREYINLGHMIEVPANYRNSEIYFLPHHSVTKETSTTTKVRIVFDGSSKTSSGVSLNDNLMVGPTIQPTLWEIILRFRTNRIALVADVEKMYRQVIVAEDHRNYQSVLWRERQDESLKCYQLTRVTFGLACSEFLAIRAMQQLVTNSKDEDVKRCILRDFYVDDILTGSDNVDQAIALKNEVTNTLAEGGFCLRKWKSNISYLCETTNELPSSDICCDKTSTIKTLGLQWNRVNDTFTFKIQAERDGAVTKRKVISESSRIFDPIGFLSPSIILLKILFQKLWLLKLDWDDKLPRDIEDEYIRIRSKFVHLEGISIPRFTNHQGEVQIHGFADSSEVAYCAVIYSRTINGDGTIITQLLTSKTKVAPLKKISLPRLELCAAHLLTKLMSKVKETLKVNAEYFAWTDSAIVLAWLSTYPMRWKTFIANRTSQILDSLPRQHWGHVKSKDNPADHGSRGITPDKIINLTQWWKGPGWLVHPQNSWPVSEIRESVQENNDMEYSKQALQSIALLATNNPYSDSWIEKLFEAESRAQRIFRIVAYVLRFINALKNPQLKLITQLTAMEIENAKLKCIIWVQRTNFEEDIRNIQRNKRVSNKSRLLPLAPFVDEDGILRVGGRLQNSDCDFDSKHPIILPQKHVFTNRIIWDVHLSKLHAGPTLTSSYIRQKYWVLNGRGRIRSILRKCVICTRYAAKTTKQIMGNLPAERVKPTRPFENCGIDFAGPIYITARKGRGRTNLTKGYICIFVCLSVKAIHIEGVTDLTSEAFLAALKRFTARRGLPKQIYTDRGSNFIGARRILDQACKLIKNIKYDYSIAEFLSQNNIRWHFIPPLSPHFGGLWEAAVKSVKRHLLKATHNINITFEEMSTLLCQIESILNSRPLYTASTNDNHEVLTPAHFLIGTYATSVPETDIHLPENRLSRWQIIQKRVQIFWKRYYLEYLNNIQQRNKWQKIEDNFKVGDTVLLKEENTPVCKWPLGRVIQVHPGPDGLVRAVTLKTSSSTLQRTVVKLCKLPVS